MIDSYEYVTWVVILYLTVGLFPTVMMLYVTRPSIKGKSLLHLLVVCLGVVLLEVFWIVLIIAIGLVHWREARFEAQFNKG